MENKNCMNCSFLCKLRYSAYSELSEDEREKVQQNNSNIINKVEGRRFWAVETRRYNHSYI